MTVPVDRPLEEWAFSRALFPTRLIQERCARKKKKRKKKKKDSTLSKLATRQPKPSPGLAPLDAEARL